MNVRAKVWASVAAIALLGGMTSTAFGIEAFQERWEWGDMSKPTKIQGRVIVVDPYDKAVWINTAIFGGNAESGYWWQEIHPGKNIKFYPANDEIWNQLKELGRTGIGPTAMKNVPPSSKTTLVEFVAQEVEQNYRVIQSVKKLEKVAGSPDKPMSIMGLYAESKGMKKEDIQKEGWTNVPNMQYDVMIPGGQKLVSGMIPWSAWK